MKRFIVVAVMVGVLATALSATALAAPATPPAQGLGQGFGPGMGIHTPGTGLAQGSAGYGMRGGMGRPAWAGQPDDVANLIKLSQADIQKERLAGKSLAQIAQAQGVTEDKLVSTILSAKKATLDKLVEGSKLDKAQAELMYGRMQTQVKAMVERTTTGPAWSTGGANAGARPGMGGRWNR